MWLLCDYGEVLSTAPTPADRAAIESAARWDPARGDFWRAYWGERPAYDRGDLTAGEYWAAVVGVAPPDGDLGELVRLDAALWLHPNPESLAAAGRASERGLRLALFSNAPVEVAREIDAAPWLASFDPRFFSCNLRAVKPEPAAYEAVLRTLGARPEEVVFVDDRPANVAAARDLGIRAEIFEDPSQFDRISGQAVRE